MRKKERLIHRYSNRKMYDTVAKAFITMGQLLGMVSRGVRVRIMDKSSGIDITHLIKIRAIASEAGRLARRMSRIASKDTARLREMAQELGRLTREMARLRRLVKREGEDAG